MNFVAKTLIKSIGCTVSKTYYTDPQVTVVSSISEPVVVSQYFGPIEEKSVSPIYEIESTQGTNSYHVKLRLNEDITDKEFFLPTTYDEENNAFIVDGTTLNDNLTLVLPHLSLWSWELADVSNVYTNKIQRFSATHRKGAYVGAGCQVDGGEYCEDYDKVLQYLSTRKYNIAYVNRGGISAQKIGQNNDGTYIHTTIKTSLPLDNSFIASEYKKYNIKPEFMFGISVDTLDVIKQYYKIYDWNFDRKVESFQNALEMYVDKWITAQPELSSDSTGSSWKYVHLNVEYFEDKNDDIAATLALIKIFRGQGWNVSVSIPYDKWGSTAIKKLKEAGASHFVYQLYNKFLNTSTMVYKQLETMRRNFDLIGSDFLDIALPYYLNENNKDHHPYTENLGDFSILLSHYKYLNLLGGATYWDLEDFDYMDQIPIGSVDSPMKDALYIERYDSLFPELVVHYSFDSNNVDDNSGIIEGSPEAVPFKGGYALHVSQDNYIRMPNSESFIPRNNSFTVSTMFYADSSSSFSSAGHIPLLTMQGGDFGEGVWFALTDASNPVLQFALNPNAPGIGGQYISSPIELGQWHHATAVVDRESNIVSLYIDGKIAVQESIEGLGLGSIDPTMDMLIGAYDYTYARNGHEQVISGDVLIDDLRIYDVALSISEIQDIFKKDTGLVAQYSFDSNSEKDDSNNDHDGLAKGGLGYTKGISGQAASFDGGDDYIELPSAEAILGTNPDEWTYSSWFNVSEFSTTTSGSGAYGTILSDYYSTGGDSLYGVRLSVNSNGDGSTGKVQASVRSAGCSGCVINSGVSVSAGEWTYVAVVVSKIKGTLEVFVNGISQGDAALDPDIDYIEDVPMSIGRDFYLGKSWGLFNGSIDEVRIYNRALSGSEVLDLYQNISEVGL